MRSGKGRYIYANKVPEL